MQCTRHHVGITAVRRASLKTYDSIYLPIEVLPTLYRLTSICRPGSLPSPSPSRTYVIYVYWKGPKQSTNPRPQTPTTTYFYIWKRRLEEVLLGLAVLLFLDETSASTIAN